MKNFTSKCLAIGKIEEFPEFSSKRLYMMDATKNLDNYDTFTNKIFEALLKRFKNLVYSGCYITIDEKMLKKGELHRRGGIHVDGNWSGDCYAHDTDGYTPEIILFCSNITGAVGYEGNYKANINIEGGASEVDFEQLKEFTMEPNVIYVTNPVFLHKTIPVSDDCKRQFVRINIVHPFNAKEQ
jgi:hypothetical protein